MMTSFTKQKIKQNIWLDSTPLIHYNESGVQANKMELAKLFDRIRQKFKKKSLLTVIIYHQYFSLTFLTEFDSN